MTITSHLKALMQAYGKKQLPVWAFKKNIRPVLLYILSAMYVKCKMFLGIVLISVSPIMISAFKKTIFLKHKALRLQQKEPYLVGRGEFVCLI